jgi:hypothetical protein
MKCKRLPLPVLAALAVAIVTANVRAETPAVENGVTRIHLDQHNGYFAAKEVLYGLKPGKYEFVVANRTGKMVGFVVQDGDSHDELAHIGLQPGETKSAFAEIDADGFRYRCPVNPTPWYDVAVDAD